MREGWVITNLGEVCDVQRGLTYSGKDTVDISNSIVLRATNIDLTTNKLILEELKYLRNDLAIDDKYRVQKGALLICFSSGSKEHLGKVAFIETDLGYYFGGFIGQIVPKSEIDPKYLFYNLISEDYKKYINRLTDGVNINNLTLTDLKKYQIPLPPLPEQEQMVSVLDSLSAELGQLHQSYSSQLQSLEELKKSILQKAFSGELTREKVSETRLAVFKDEQDLSIAAEP